MLHVDVMAKQSCVERKMKNKPTSYNNSIRLLVYLHVHILTNNMNSFNQIIKKKKKKKKHELDQCVNTKYISLTISNELTV